MDWFLRQGSRVEGPLAEADLRSRIAAGKVTADAFVAPSRHDLGELSFRPLREWDGLLAEMGRGRVAEQKGTALLGTEEPFLSVRQDHIKERGTALLGTDGALPVQSPKEARWPGAPQEDPTHPEPHPHTHAARHKGSDQSFFETVPADSPRAPEKTAAPFTDLPDSEPLFPKEPEPAVARSPLTPIESTPFEAASFAPVPAPRLLPVKKPSSGRLVALAIVLTLGLGSLGAWAADRVINGPRSSNISRYLPGGAPYYLEVPSMKRWTAGFGRMAFLRSQDRAAAEFLESLSQQIGHGSDAKVQTRRFASIDSFALTQVSGQTLFAIHYETDEGMVEYLKTLPKEAQTTEWGKRYETATGHLCLWLDEDYVEICGKGDALDAALDALAGRVPSAEEDPYLKAAKKRPFFSSLPFADVPAFYAVGNQALFPEGSAWSDVSLATLTGGLDTNGYHEKIDLVFRPGKSPRFLRTGTPLTLWRDLPEGTIVYANFHLQFAKDRQDFEKEVRSAVALPPGVLSIDEIVTQMEEALGFHPAELTKGLASETLVAITFPPEEALTGDPKNEILGALWLHLTIADHGEVRRTLNALVERLSGEKSTLFWKDENNLVGTFPSGLGAHLFLEKNLLRVGIGHIKEVTRGFRSSKRLSEDPAHEAAMADLGEEISAFGWLDGGRLLAEPRLASGFQKPVSEHLASLGETVALQGPSRPTAAFFVRQFESGDLRVRSRNFPTGLLLFALGTLGPTSAEAPLDTEPIIGPPSTDAETPPHVGPGPDGTFRLPPPSSGPPPPSKPNGP